MFGARILELGGERERRQEFLAAGADPEGVRIMLPKGIFRVVKLKGVEVVPATIIKQEMLSRGGEVVLARGALKHTVDKTDVLILGTEGQILSLIEKLAGQKFGLPAIAEEIRRAVDNFEKTPVPLKVGALTLEFGKRTYLMGILNVTPDSFSDGGKYFAPDQAVAFGLKMAEDGADIIDVGGESTRPGSRPVSEDEELKRVLPVIQRLSREAKIPLSIDTRKARVAEEALAAGAKMVNDTRGLNGDYRMKEVVAKAGVPVIIMHGPGEPATMQDHPYFEDLLSEVSSYLAESIDQAVKAGVAESKIIIDPGIGFGKTLEHNLTLLKHLREFRSLGRPIAVGTSRKSLIGRVLNLPAEERLEGTAATVALAIARGADLVRVHDVREMRRVVMMTDAVVRTGKETGTVLK